MQVKDKVVLVTGGGNGIGAALCRGFRQEGARGVAVVDIDAEGAHRVAEEVDGMALVADVSVEADIIRAVQTTEKQYGPIDLLCSNAGVAYNDEPDWKATSCPNEKCFHFALRPACTFEKKQGSHANNTRLRLPKDYP